jgi:hypothetical protein
VQKASNSACSTATHDVKTGFAALGQASSLRTFVSQERMHDRLGTCYEARQLV